LASPIDFVPLAAAEKEVVDASRGKALIPVTECPRKLLLESLMVWSPQKGFDCFHQYDP
jgi:hypothetical protein